MKKKNYSVTILLGLFFLVITACYAQPEETSATNTPTLIAQTTGVLPFVVTPDPNSATSPAFTPLPGTIPATPLPSPTQKPRETPEPTRTPKPTATAVVVVVTPNPDEPDCRPLPEDIQTTKIGITGPSFCIVWLDLFNDELGYRVILEYDRSGERFTYEVGPDITQLLVPEAAAPRPDESQEQCMLRYNSFAVTVIALRPDGESLVNGMAANMECDLRTLPTATP